MGATQLTGKEILDATVTESDIGLADVITLNVSATKHGFAPKGDGTTTKFLNANGAYSTPAGGAGGDIAMTILAPAIDETITAGYSAVVNRKYTVASGKKLVLGLGSIFRIH